MKFEVVSKYADAGINLPVRKTAKSAGYDFEVAEDIVIPSYHKLIYDLTDYADNYGVRSLEEVAAITKRTKAKPTLVPTGIKCEIPDGFYLELSPRSSCPLKHWLILANSVGIIDADYYNNPDNEGHIYFQFINLSPFDIQLHKGDAIGQGILKKYYVTDDDAADGFRAGGFGSTDNLVQLMFPQFYQDEHATAMSKVDGGQGVSDEECVMACNPERRAFLFGASKTFTTEHCDVEYSGS